MVDEMSEVLPGNALRLNSSLYNQHRLRSVSMRQLSSQIVVPAKSLPPLAPILSTERVRVVN